MRGDHRTFSGAGRLSQRLRTLASAARARRVLPPPGAVYISGSRGVWVLPRRRADTTGAAGRALQPRWA